MRKKGVMGIGMLIIFISTILVSAVAAGVIIRSSGILQQRALEVEESTRQRLVTRVEVVAVDAVANITTEQVLGFEILVRLGAGSYPLSYDEFAINFASENLSASAGYSNSSGGSCLFSGINSETEFCSAPRFGNDNDVLESNELMLLKYKLSPSNYLHPNDEFLISFIPVDGSVVDMNLKVPNVLNKRLNRIRI